MIYLGLPSNMAVGHQRESQDALQPIHILNYDNGENGQIFNQNCGAQKIQEKKPKSCLELLKYFQPKRNERNTTKSCSELMKYLQPIRQEDWEYSLKDTVFTPFWLLLFLHLSLSISSPECIEITLPVVQIEPSSEVPCKQNKTLQNGQDVQFGELMEFWNDSKYRGTSQENINLIGFFHRFERESDSEQVCKEKDIGNSSWRIREYQLFICVMKGCSRSNNLVRAINQYTCLHQGGKKGIVNLINMLFIIYPYRL